MKKHKNSKSNHRIPTLPEFFKKIEKKKETSPTQSSQSFQNTYEEQNENQLIVKTEILSSPKKRKNCEISSITINSNSPKRLCLSQIPSTSNSSPTVKYQKSNVKTPEKNKSHTNKTSRTPPRKLFQRTPTKVSDFSVNIIENFIKITPSKSSEGQVSPSNSGKMRISPMNSPLSSIRSEEAQKLNERTPKKETPRKTILSTSPFSRVKAKLDFGHSKIDTKKFNFTVEEETSEGKVIHNENIKESISENSIDKCISNFLDNEFDEELLADNDGTVTHEYNLDLSESQYCKIIKIEFFPSYNKVTIKSNVSEEYAICILKDFWFNTKLEIGVKLHVMAKKIDSDWVVNNQNGLIIYEPDLLVSCTSVVSSLFCKRKSILSSRFQGFEAGNEYMLIGTLVHSILQQTLKLKLNKSYQVENILENTLTSKDAVRKIYESGLTIEMVKSKMAIYIPRILEFVEVYIQGTKKQYDKNCWHGQIDSIEDIEDNIWCRELGIKGKIDVTVKSGLKVMPLELKTGKSSLSLEHRGQVLLYVMMMNKLGHKVSSGLLLYLKDGIMKEITISDNEKRDILILRNEFAYYLKKKSKVVRSKFTDKIQKLETSDLPNPISFESACKKCPYNIICSSFLQYNKDDSSSNKVMDKVKDEVLSHLSEKHINYFILWSSLINLEEVSERPTSKSVEDLLTSAPAQRESKGKCISNLKIIEISEEFNGIMDHTFMKREESNSNFFSSGIEEGNYCVISTDTRQAIVSGFVSLLDAHSVTIAIDKNLRQKYPCDNFHVDTYESSYSHAFNQTCLTLLLEPSVRADQLRSIIIDKKEPTFSKVLPKVIAVKGMPILKRLNQIQRKAVLQAISANEYLLIKGMPGTGKTATIVALVEMLSLLGKTVLITSHTHSAVDNICTKLSKRNVDFMRLGNTAKINSTLQKYSEAFRTKDCSTPEQLAEVYNNTNIIAVTCLGSGHPILSKRTLDFCIVDESTQVLQSTVVRPIYSAKVFILVGDPEQLPPVVRNSDAIDLGMAKSLFEILENEKNVISLTMNYRMNKVITKIANDLTYKGHLLVADEKTGNATLCIPKKQEMFESFKTFDWMQEVLNTSLENSVKLIDTGPVWNRSDKVSWNLNQGNTEFNSMVNIYEAAITYHLTLALLKGGVNPQCIGVITTYTHQLKQLSCILDEHIDVSTVDRFQGRDKDVIIYSCTKSTDPSVNKTKSKFEILEDHRRLNVALTRAKTKLIIIGDFITIKNYSPFAKLLTCIGDSHIIKLQEKYTFNWYYLLNNVKKKAHNFNHINISHVQVI